MTLMPDIFTKEKRSQIMSRIRSTGTKIELKMKNALEESGMQFRYQPKMFGKPDFFIPPNIVIFCDSSFWHGRNWKRLSKQLKTKYWYDHIKRNKERDTRVTATLRNRGYVVLRFWDFEIEKHIERCIYRITEKVQQEQSELIASKRKTVR